MNIHNNSSSPFLDNLTVPDQEIDKMSALKMAQQVLGQVFITLKKKWTKLLDELVGNSEPKITQKRDRNGHIFWDIYDPVTGHFSRLNSELGVRCWIEERYYSNLFSDHH